MDEWEEVESSFYTNRDREKPGIGLVLETLEEAKATLQSRKESQKRGCLVSRILDRLYGKNIHIYRCVTYRYKGDEK